MVHDGGWRGVGRRGAAWKSAMAGVAVVALVAAVGCGKFNQLKGAKSFKAANTAYQQQDYKQAAELYEQTLASDAEHFPAAYFFLGNCYDNMWKPSKKGDAQNDKLLENAAKNYAQAAEKLRGATDPQLKLTGTRALQYLVLIYGTDKLNDPGQAEPILQKMITADPSDPANYFQLATLYENAGVPDEAERVFMMAKQAKPNDPVVYTTLAAYYNRQGQFDKTIAALEERASKDPNNPEAYHTIASYYWDEASKDTKLRDNEKKDYVLKGIKAADRALSIKNDYGDAMVFKGLLLRQQALLEKDPKIQQQLLKDANDLRDKAEDIRKKKASGVGN